MARSARAKHYRTTGVRKKETQTSVARAALGRIQKKLVSESSTNSVPVEAEKQKKNKKKTAPRLNLKGNRIVDLTHLSKSLQKVINHSSVCPCNGNPHMEQEIERKGLACVIQFRCDECGITLGVETQPKCKGPRGQPRYNINISAVWGFMATGGGHSNMEEVLSLLNIPSPDKKTFTNIEEHVGAVWKEALTADMIEAGKEEKRLAVASNNIDQGIPAINVVVDGGWSMRSHQHRYTAKSGVAVIIGERTKKLLYLGCAGTGLCFQHGTGFHSKVVEQCIGEKAGPVLEAPCADIDKKRTADRKYGYLGASPDGIVVLKGSLVKGLIEVKCPYSATRKGVKYTPMEAAQNIKKLPLEIKPNGKLSLKKITTIVQGQMFITGYKWCDYVVWTPSGIHIERIAFDNDFWQEKMIPNLKWFYFNCILPEIASPRHPQGILESLRSGSMRCQEKSQWPQPTKEQKIQVVDKHLFVIQNLF
ncbi:hypothetical protein ACROYT_G005338 [Oculina patagonica]